jgi:tRNA pseudouridine38-40 synthase
MVRAIVGTMLEIGDGKIKSTDINNIILSKDRSKAGYSVPALGLSLFNVEYENDIIDERN